MCDVLPALAWLNMTSRDFDSSNHHGTISVPEYLEKYVKILMGMCTVRMMITTATGLMVALV